MILLLMAAMADQAAVVVDGLALTHLPVEPV
jgi:hypothetical protein